MLTASVLLTQIEEAMLAWEALLYGKITRGPGQEPEVVLQWQTPDGVARYLQVSISEPVPEQGIGMAGLQFIGAAWYEWEHDARRRWKVEDLDELWLGGDSVTGQSGSGELGGDSGSIDKALQRAQHTVSAWTISDLGRRGRLPPRVIVNVLPSLLPLQPQPGAPAGEADQ